jgi:hypothetical protein
LDAPQTIWQIPEEYNSLFDGGLDRCDRLFFTKPYVGCKNYISENEQERCMKNEVTFKGIVGASSNLLGKNKAFLKLKYLL